MELVASNSLLSLLIVYGNGLQLLREKQILYKQFEKSLLNTFVTIELIILKRKMIIAL